MPELRFVLRWPDGTWETCYSPSTVVRDHFDPAHSIHSPISWPGPAPR